MEASIIVAGSAVVVALGGNIIVGIGLAKTWRRNGSEASAKYGALQTHVTAIGDDVTDLSRVVTDMDRKVDKFQLHCADVSGRMDERMQTVERESKELRNKAPG